MSSLSTKLKFIPINKYFNISLWYLIQATCIIFLDTIKIDLILIIIPRSVRCLQSHVMFILLCCSSPEIRQELISNLFKPIKLFCLYNLLFFLFCDETDKSGPNCGENVIWSDNSKPKLFVYLLSYIYWLLFYQDNAVIAADDDDHVTGTDSATPTVFAAAVYLARPMNTINI